VRLKGSFNEDYQIIPRNESKAKWLNTTGHAELDDQGEVTGVIGTILDISEQKEDDLRKNDFIGMVSHELKTPLTTLNGYAQMMQLKARKSGDGYQEETVGKMLNQVKKMTTLINGFLNVSRLQSGKIHLNKTEFDVAALISETIEETQFHSNTHQFLFDPGTLVNIYADRDKIGTVLSNLLSNAAKYSPNATQVVISCEVKEDQVIIGVEDQGMGIKPHELTRLFDRYFRVESQENQLISGFGIGLYLSAEVIKRHDGKIWAESEINKGSVFRVALPIKDLTV